MHIVVLENEPSSLRGGQELSLLDVCRCLSNRGHSISLLYVKEGDLLKQYREFCSELVSIHGYRIERKSTLTSLSNFFTDIRKIKTSKDSIVYSNQYHDSFWGYTLALSKSIPFVCHLRLPPPKTLGFQWNIGMRGAKQLIAVSNQTKFEWVKRGFKEDKIHVVYNAINTEKFQRSDQISLKHKWGVSEDVRVISYVGRLDREKGLETLIKGFALFINEYPNSKLLIAGKPLRQDDNYKKSLLKLSTDLGIEKDVSFLGHLTDTISLYRASDITVLPSLHSEPFGRTIIESMACGTPVVASRTGGISEILTGEFQNGLFKPGDERDLSDTLNFMFKWREKDSQLAIKCRSHVLSNFNLDRMVEGVEKVLLKVVK